MMDLDRPTAKRQKLTNDTPKSKSTASRLFAPYRTIGLVSPTNVPFTSIPLGKTTFQITTSVGRALQTYDLRKGLNIVFITRPQTPQVITASIAWKDKIIAAWGGADNDDGAEQRSSVGLWVFKRGKREAELELPKGWDHIVRAFCIFGSWIVGVCENQLLVWKSATFELYTTLQGTSPVPFTSCVASLPTFLNKIIVGRQNGSVELWNVSTGKLVYTILPPSTAYGAITALEPTPALALVAIAYANGPLLIHDIRTDQTVMNMSSPASMPITSITFRTDGTGAGEDGRSAGVMATASTSSGDITLWDLNKGGRKSGVLRAAHASPTPTSPGGVSRVGFLHGQAMLVSSGLDNSLQTWIFDQTPFSPVPRILHSRRGHGASITRLQFLPSASDGSDDTGKWLLSSSLDRSLWGWSLRRDGQSTELSQGAIQAKAKKQGLLSGDRENALQDLKCPPITAMACSLNRDGGIGAVPGKHAIWQGASSKGKKAVDAEVSAMTGWESVITAHANDRKARTWFWGRKRAGRWAFETGDGGNVSSVALSPCGTFALVGSEKGGVDMYNLQSGLHRQRFPARLTAVQAKQLKIDLERQGLLEEEDDESGGKKKFYRGQGKHTSAVVGLAVDALNKTIVSAGADGRVKFWDFGAGVLQHELDWSSQAQIIEMRFHRPANLAAFSCTDGCVRVVDITTYRVIRELFPSRPTIPASLLGHSIVDFTFSSDGRWIAACMGRIILLWDLPTGHLVDAFKLRSACTSLAFSPTGEFLATATTDDVGVDVWSNRSLYGYIATRRIDVDELEAIAGGLAQAPTASGEGGTALVATENDDEDEDVDQALLDALDDEDAVDELSSDLLSLSIVPRARWQNLLHLDLIRQRNKPTEAPKKPEKAPFFLPSLQERQDAASKHSVTTTIAEVKQEQSRFLQLDRAGGQSALATLMSNAASAQDFSPLVSHFRDLSPAAADIAIRSLSIERGELTTFVQALIWLLRERRDFELGQVWMSVFLRIHGSMVAEDDELRDAVNEWRDTLVEEKSRVQMLTGYCGGIVGYLRAARV